MLSAPSKLARGVPCAPGRPDVPQPAPRAEEPATALADAAVHCRRLASSHYENFPTASLLLPARVRPAVAAIYAFARIADDFADEPEHEGVRSERLQEWRRLLDEALAGRPRGPVFVALSDAITRFDLPAQPLRDLILAFEQDVVTPRYATWDAMLDYCTRSADPVGRLVLALHGIRDDASVAASDAICTGLQLTNFWQDVAIDLGKDRIYLPAEDLARHGMTEADLFTRTATPAFRALLRDEIVRTRSVFARGLPLVRDTRGRLGLWLRCVWAGGHAILDRIEAEGCDVFARRPKLSRLDWARLLVPALVGRVSPGAAAPGTAIVK